MLWPYCVPLEEARLGSQVRLQFWRGLLPARPPAESAPSSPGNPTGTWGRSCYDWWPRGWVWASVGWASWGEGMAPTLSGDSWVTYMEGNPRPPGRSGGCRGSEAHRCLVILGPQGLGPGPQFPPASKQGLGPCSQGEAPRGPGGGGGLGCGGRWLVFLEWVWVRCLLSQCGLQGRGAWGSGLGPAPVASLAGCPW